MRAAALLERCPFLRAHVDAEDLDLPTVVFGAAALAIRGGRLTPDREDAVFACFNALAERGNAQDLDSLGTGAIELFNDDAASQRLARRELTGPALAMLEEYRAYWGQPDYGVVAP